MRRFWRGFPLILLALSPAAFGQIRLSPGIQVGAPLTDTLVSSSSSSTSDTYNSFSRFNSVTKRLVIGPSLRLDLPRGLGLEFDALYQRVNYDYATSSVSPGSYSDQSFEQGTANRWQFPLLVQYGRNVGKIKPFVEAGPSISTIAGGNSTVRTTTVNVPSPASSSTSTLTIPAVTNAGITAGGGVSIPFHGHSLRVEARFSHWFTGTTTAGFPNAAFVSGDFSAVPESESVS